MFPDPYDGSYDAVNPQSLNRCAYVLNDPLGFTDPLGLGPQDCEDAGDRGCTSSCDPNYVDQNGNPYTPNSNGGISGGSGGTVNVNSGDLSDIGVSVNSSEKTSGGGLGSNTAKRLACAAKFGQASSIEAAFGCGKVANLLGADSVSSPVNRDFSLSGQPFSSPPYLIGIGMGLPVNDVLRFSGGQTNPLYDSASGSVRVTTPNVKNRTVRILAQTYCQR